jgi:integrase
MALMADYFACRDCCTGYRRGFEQVVRSLVAFARRDDVAALDVATVNAWLATIHRSAATRRNYRNTILALWAWLAREGMAPPPAPEKIRRPQVRVGVPQCWTVEEVRQLLSVARRLAGALPNGVAQAAYWWAAIRLAWETGLRRSDVWRVSMDDVVRDLLVVVSAKSGQRTVHQLTAATVQSLQVIARPWPLLWPYRPNRFGLHFERIVQAAGIRRGTFKWLRRSSGSYVAANHGEAAGAQHLGHTSLATFRRYYDARLVGRSRPMPPEL